MAKFGDAVRFNSGSGKAKLAFVRGTGDDGKLDLVILNEDGNQFEDDVPRRDPADYGAEGGGRTWHPA